MVSICPFSVQVRQYSALDKPSKMGNDNGTMGRPWGIAFNRDSMWALGDNLNHSVHVFDSHDSRKSDPQIWIHW